MLFVENTGSCGEPSLRTDPLLFTVDDTIATSGYNVPVLEDVDSDGDLDLFVGVLGGAFNPNLTTTRNFHFYEQVDGDFIHRTERFVYTLDVGGESIPSFADLDGDGDLDMLLANKLDPDDTQTSRLYHFENVGSPRAPSFEQRAHIPLFTMYHYAPALGDLDGDGDLDMLVGTWNRGVALYLNQGTRAQPEFVLQDTTFVRLTRGSNSAPALTDVDGDGISISLSESRRVNSTSIGTSALHGPRRSTSFPIASETSMRAGGVFRRSRMSTGTVTRTCYSAAKRVACFSTEGWVPRRTPIPSLSWIRRSCCRSPTTLHRPSWTSMVMATWTSSQVDLVEG